VAATNGIPLIDGDLTVYTSPADSPHARAGYRIYYVNGMATMPEAHHDEAVALARLFCHNVIGVYNASGTMADRNLHLMVKKLESMRRQPSFTETVTIKFEALNQVAAGVLDFGQCTVDYAEQVVLAAAGLPLPVLGMPSKGFGRLADATRRRAMADAVLSLANNATREVFRELYRYAQPGERIRIIAHSQGNLVTANALCMLLWVRGGMSIGDVRVYALASPSFHWPTGNGLQVSFFSHPQDPVTWLSLGRSYADATVTDARDAKGKPEGVGFGAHDFYGYTGIDQFVGAVRSDMGLPVEM
jgi:hypothetical protein